MEVVLFGTLRPGALLRSFEIMNVLLPYSVSVGPSMAIEFLYLLLINH